MTRNGADPVLPWLIAAVFLSLIVMRLRHRRPSRRQRVLEVFLRYPTTHWYVLDLCRVARLHVGSIYPELDRLEQEEWIFSNWEDPAGPYPRRRIYWLNRARVDQEAAP